MKTKTVLVAVLSAVMAFSGLSALAQTNYNIGIELGHTDRVSIINSVVGQAYEVQSSTNLVDWRYVGSVIGDGATVYVTNTMYGHVPSQQFYRSVLAAQVVSSARGTLSLDGSSPVANTVPVSDTINGNYSGLPVFTFDVYAQNDTLHVHSATVHFTVGTANGTGVTLSTAYLYYGSTQVQSATVVNGVAVFDNITDGTSGATIPVGTTMPYTIKVDVSGVTSGSISITANMIASEQTIYDSMDYSAPVTGSATGNTITVAGSGPSITHSSDPWVTTSGQNQYGQFAPASTIVASFPLTITSIGGDTYFGTSASTNEAYWFSVVDSAGTIVYTGNGTTSTVNTAGLTNVQVILAQLPTSVLNGVTQPNIYVVRSADTVNLGVVQFQFSGKSADGSPLTGGPYKVFMTKVDYTFNGTPASLSLDQSYWITSVGVNP